MADNPKNRDMSYLPKEALAIKYIYVPSLNMTIVREQAGTDRYVKGQLIPPSEYYASKEWHVINNGEYGGTEETCIVYIPAYMYDRTALRKLDIPYDDGTIISIPTQKTVETQETVLPIYEEGTKVALSLEKSSTSTRKDTDTSDSDNSDLIINGKIVDADHMSPASLYALYQEYIKNNSKGLSYTEWLTELQRTTPVNNPAKHVINTALNIANSMQDAYTDKEIVDAGVVLEQTPLQTLADYPALAEILQANIPANVFTESKVAEATALTDAKRVAEQLGLPSLIEYLQMHTQAADTQNAATKQAIDLASAQLYDRLRKKDHEWLTSQTETASKKASTDTGTQAAALLETLANAKGEDLETIVKSFTDNLATAEEMQKALNEAYLTGQSQYDTGRLNIAQHTNDANAIAAKNLATIGALFEVAQQSENSYNKAKADYATSIQDINSAAQRNKVADVVDILTEGNTADIQRSSVATKVANILDQYTTSIDSEGSETVIPNYSNEQKAAVLDILRQSGLYDADEAHYTAEQLNRLVDATVKADDNFLIKDPTAQSILNNRVINSVLFDPYEQARRTKIQNIDEYARSIGVEIDPAYYAALYDMAAKDSFNTYNAQRRTAETTMLRNLIADDQQTNAPLKKRTTGALTNNDRVTSAATQLSNMQNNATNNSDAIWNAFVAERTAPAKEAAARSKAATDAVSYYQDLMTGYAGSSGTGGVLQQMNMANNNSATNLQTYGSLAQQGMSGVNALNEANTNIANSNANAYSNYKTNINTLNKNRSIQNLQRLAYEKQAAAGNRLGAYNVNIN